MKWSKYVIDLEYEDGEAIYKCNATVRGVTDPSYGADADGNRGVSMDITEDVILEDIEVTTIDEDGEVKEVRDNVMQYDLPDDVRDHLEVTAIESEGGSDEDNGDY